eukprot:6510965-Alexandrium_andersonii.AAC.1
MEHRCGFARLAKAKGWPSRASLWAALWASLGHRYEGQLETVPFKPYMVDGLPGKSLHGNLLLPG